MKLVLAHIIMLVGALTPVAQARVRGVLFCEHSNSVQYYTIRGTHADYSNLRACFSTNAPGSTGCRSVQTDYMSPVGGDEYYNFQWAYTMQLQCDWAEYAGLCRYNSYSGTWYRVRRCSYGGHEAIVTLVHDHDPNRRLGGKDQDEEQDMPLKASTEEVEIDGETWTIVGFGEDDEDVDEDEEEKPED